jgi:hypothetical protein
MIVHLSFRLIHDTAAKDAYCNTLPAFSMVVRFLVSATLLAFSIRRGVHVHTEDPFLFLPKGTSPPPASLSETANCSAQGTQRNDINGALALIRHHGSTSSSSPREWSAIMIF